MKDIIIFLLISIVGFLGLSFSSILFYVSPDGTPHLLEGSITFMATSIFLFSYLVTLKIQLNLVLKWVILLLSTVFIVKGFLLGMSSSSEYFVDIEFNKMASYIINISILLVAIGIYLVGRKMGKQVGITNEK